MLTMSLLQRHELCEILTLTSVKINPHFWMEISFAAYLQGQGIQTVEKQQSGKEILKEKLRGGWRSLGVH